MHLSLDDMNRILEQRGSEKDRADLVDHVVNCPKCQRRFQALHQLHQHEKQSVKKPNTLVFAAAAAVFLAITGIFAIRQITPPMQKAPSYSQASMDVEESHQMGLLGEIHRVNLKGDLPKWSESENVMDLVQKARQRS